MELRSNFPVRTGCRGFGLYAPGPRPTTELGRAAKFAASLSFSAPQAPERWMYLSHYGRLALALALEIEASCLLVWSRMHSLVELLHVSA